MTGQEDPTRPLQFMRGGDSLIPSFAYRDQPAGPAEPLSREEHRRNYATTVIATVYVVPVVHFRNTGITWALFPPQGRDLAWMIGEELQPHTTVGDLVEYCCRTHLGISTPVDRRHLDRLSTMRVDRLVQIGTQTSPEEVTRHELAEIVVWSVTQDTARSFVLSTEYGGGNGTWYDASTHAEIAARDPALGEIARLLHKGIPAVAAREQ